MYVYIYCKAVFTVGFYAPDGEWNPESDWGTPEEAAARVHYLNGGHNDDTRIEHLENVAQLSQEYRHQDLDARFLIDEARINEIEMWRGNRPGG